MKDKRIIKYKFNKWIMFKSIMLQVTGFLCGLCCLGCTQPDLHAETVLQTEQETQTEQEIQRALEEADESAASDEQMAAQSITIVMVGDVLLHTPINDSALQEDGSYNYTHLFSHVKEDIQAADIAIVNQEVILGGTELGLSGYPAFNGAYEVADALTDTGFDVVLHATNHALDKGRQGILNCLDYWREKHPQMKTVGIYDSAEAQKELCFCEQNGIKVAIINYTYGTNGIALPGDMPYAVNLLNEAQVRNDVERAKKQADFVVVCPHWGTEYSHEISEQQEKYARLFAELGVDLVIGTHPHVIEPVEWVDGTLVYYSLGNFINATSGSGRGVADRMVGAMAEVTLGRRDDGKVIIEDYGVEPLVTQMLTGRNRITTYKLCDYSQALADENEIIERDSAFSLNYCRNLCNKVFGDIQPLDF